MATDLTAFIKTVLAQIDIVSVIQSQVSLKKAGNNYQGLCPFHHEKSPSFSVNPTKQFFYCFGCHASGDALSFVMRHENLAFMEALEKLAKQVGLSIPSNQQSGPSIDRIIYQLMRDMTISCREDLNDADQVKQYLKTRGISIDTQRKFHIGYCGAKYQTWFRDTCNRHARQLTDAGVALKNQTGYKPKFKQRLMFPIQDSKGKVIGYGGRSLTDQPPKYLNSPESDIFKKRYILYGLYQFRALKKEHVYVVEGYMDVLSLHSKGIENAVACLGTAFTTHHWHLIKRFVRRVTFCFDGDRAGQAAAWKSLTAILPVIDPVIEIKFLFLPEEHDPDSYIQAHGLQSFHDLSKTSIPWTDFFQETLAQKHTPNDIAGRAAFLQTAQALIDTMENIHLKTVMTTSVREIAGLTDEQVDTKPQMAARNDTKNSIHQHARAAVAQLIKKNNQPIHQSPTLNAVVHEPFIDLINTWLHQLESHSSITGEELLAQHQGTSIYTELAEIKSKSQREYHPDQLQFLLLSLRYLLIDELIAVKIQPDERRLNEDERRVLQSLIVEKQTIRQQKRELQSNIKTT